MHSEARLAGHMEGRLAVKWCAGSKRGMDTRTDYAGGEQSTRVETIQGVRSELAAKLKSNKGYSKAQHNAFRYIF